MFNQRLGSCEHIDDRSCIVTGVGPSGHALYGPYASLAPGRYVVEFEIGRADAPERGRDVLAAVIDVVRDAGNVGLARRELMLSDLGTERRTFALTFEVAEPSRVEYRVWTSGKAPLVIEGYRRVMPVPAGAHDPAALLHAGGFPDAAGAPVPFFAANRALLRSLYERDMGVRIADGGVVLDVRGVALHARTLDDMNFVGEVFHENVYTIETGTALCVIDIGMNIGLTSLMMASRDTVREVHAFEPFAATYARAQANLALNPRLAAKISAHDFGLSDRDWSGDVIVAAGSDSGAMSTVGARDGVAEPVVLRDAGTVLAPIIALARANGLAVIVKMDIEGSEFAVFAALERAGLLATITAFMVEWHAMFDDRTQADLIGPLTRRGFLVFDRSPPTGNGFFYAARIAAA